MRDDLQSSVATLLCLRILCVCVCVCVCDLAQCKLPLVGPSCLASQLSTARLAFSFAAHLTCIERQSPFTGIISAKAAPAMRLIYAINSGTVAPLQPLPQWMPMSQSARTDQ